MSVKDRAMSKGTLLAPRFYDGPAEVTRDIHLSQQFFIYETETGLVSGKTFNVMFTIDRSAKDVWPYFKDPNLWQNAYGHFYSGVVGDLYSSEEHDLGQQTFALSGKPDDFGSPQYRVLRVIPGHAMVFFQPIPQEGTQNPAWFFGRGGVSPGFHIFMLNGHGDKTVATIQMEHATRTQHKDVEEALAPWREMAKESHRKFRDVLIPALKKLVYERHG